MSAPGFAASPDVTLDAFLGGRLTLAQFRRGHHRAGTDGVLAAMAAAPLAAEMAARSPDGAVDVLDMGAGCGVIGLAVAQAVPGARVALAERDAQLAALCRDNASRNGLAQRVRVAEADLLARPAELAAAGLAPGSQDLVVTNPPWFAPGRVRPSPGDGRRAAHVFAPEDSAAEAPLAAWLRAACRLLRPGGLLLVIHRAEALPELLASMARRFGDIRVAPVAPRAGAPAVRVLVRAARGRRSPFVLEPALTLHEADGRFTPLAGAVHAGAPLPWGSWGAAAGADGAGG